MKDLREMQKANTADFLASYAIISDLREADENEPADAHKTTGNVKLAAIKGFSPDLACGQIRLLADVEQLTYIVLLKEWDENSYVVMPFSHYNFPATDEELSLGRYSGAYLNVLQAWNTRTLQNSILCKSWVCGTLPENDLQDAWTFYTSMITGEKLDEKLLVRTGSAIDADDDIRLEYMQEELAVFAEIDAFDLSIADEDSGTNILSLDQMFGKLMIPALWEPDEMVLAAGDEEDNINRKCTIDDRNEMIVVEYSPAEETMWLDVFEKDSAQRAFSLDSAEIVDVDENVLGVIADGKCEITDLAVFDGCFAIRLADGMILLLNNLDG